MYMGKMCYYSSTYCESLKCKETIGGKAQTQKNPEKNNNSYILFPVCLAIMMELCRYCYHLIIPANQWKAE